MELKAELSDVSLPSLPFFLTKVHSALVPLSAVVLWRRSRVDHIADHSWRLQPQSVHHT